MDVQRPDNQVTVTVAESAQQPQAHSDLWLASWPAVVAVFGSLAAVLLNNHLQRKREREQAEKNRQLKALEDIAEAIKECSTEVSSQMGSVFNDNFGLSESVSVDRVFALFAVHFPDGPKDLIARFRLSYRTVVHATAALRQVHVTLLPRSGVPDAEYQAAFKAFKDGLVEPTAAMHAAYAEFAALESALLEAIASIASGVHNSGRRSWWRRWKQGKSAA